MNKPFNYQAEAEQTNSPHYHATKVPNSYFEKVIKYSILQMSLLDDVKKAIFYGRDLPQQTLDLFTTEEKLDQMFEPESKAMTVPLVHAIIGIATEAGELLECFDKDVFDRVNFIEEVGDVLWYLAIGLNSVGSTIEEAQRTNIAKLRKRYPEKFTEYDANNRDLNAERDVLEGINNFHPEEYSNAFLKGMDDFRQGLNDFQCPYPPTLNLDSDYGDWHKGYNFESSRAPRAAMSFGKSAAWEAGRHAHSVGRPRAYNGDLYDPAEVRHEWFEGWDHNERMTKEGQAIKSVFANSVKIGNDATEHLLSSEVNAKRLRESIAEVKIGNDGINIDLTEGTLTILEKGEKVFRANGSFEIDGHRLNFQQAQTYIALKQTGKLGELLDRYELPM